MSSGAQAAVTRDWAATAFVVWRDTVMLHRHAKLGLWLPCGGHVEPGEVPDDAAVREVQEESGVSVELLGERAVGVPGPRSLVRPRGVQLEAIAPNHEHVDLIYLARPREPYDGILPRAAEDPSLGWYDRDALAALDLSDEVRAWCELALEECAGQGAPRTLR